MIKNILNISALILCYIICYHVICIAFNYLEIEIKPKILEFTIQYALGIIIVNNIWSNKK